MSVRPLGRLLPALAVMFAAAGLAAISACSVANSKPDERTKALESLVKVEQDFANGVRFTGMRESFLAFADPEAILFRPAPVPAIEWLNRQSPSPGILTWTPTYADVSTGGDLGWTTGPWEFAASKTERPRDFGQYVSIWRRQPDGSWRYLLDVGTGNLKPIGPAGSVMYSPAPPRTATARRSEKPAECEAALLAFERSLADSTRARGARTALAPWIADDARLLRRGSLPAYGRANVSGALPGPRDTLTWEPSRAVVAKQCDLAFTYGSYSLRPSPTSYLKAEDGYYLRIWRRLPGGGWGLALDLLASTPHS